MRLLDRFKMDASICMYVDVVLIEQRKSIVITFVHYAILDMTRYDVSCYLAFFLITF